MFLMASCGTSVSPQNSYASQMTPALEKLATWQKHNTTIEGLFNDPVTAANGVGMSRMEMLDLYNMATEYKITREDYVNLGFSQLDVLVGEAVKVANTGKEIESLMSSLTPDQEIQTAHETVLKCVQARSAFADKLSSSIRDLGPVDLSGDDSVCKTFDASLKEVTDYVNGQQ